MAEVVDKVVVSTQTWEESLLDLNQPLIDFIFDLFKYAEARLGENNVWLKDVERNKEILIGQVIPYSKKVAHIFQKKGLKSGDLVTIIGNNSVNYYIPIFATWLCGAAVNLMDPWVGQSTMEQQFRMKSTQFIVCIPEVYEKVKESLSALDQMATFYLFEKTDKEMQYEDVRTIEDFLSEDLPTDNLNFSTEAISSNALAGIHWSSGSTGKPKGIQLSSNSYLRNMAVSLTHPFMIYKHLNFLNRFWIFRKMFTFALSKLNTGPMLVCTWMFHLGGFVTPIVSGLRGSVYFLQPNNLSPQKLLDIMSTYKAAHCLGSYHDFIQLSCCTPSPKMDLSSVKAIFAVGAKLPEKSCQNLMKIFPSVKQIPDMYGATEMGGIAMTFTSGTGSTVYPFVKVKIVNLETGEKCSPNEVGEICAKSNGMMLGYLGLDNSQFFDEERFFKTGDIGYYDMNGLVYYTDRLKDLIKVGLHHVYPAEVETILQQHADVSVAGVFGVPDDKEGEVCAALVEVRSGSQVTELQLESWVNERTEKWKNVMKVKIVDKLPTNNMGKKVRKEMKAVFETGSD